MLTCPLRITGKQSGNLVSAGERRGAGGDSMTDYRKVRAAVGCPKCAAKPSNPCVNAYGSQMRLLHPCRWRAAAEEGKRLRIEAMVNSSLST